MDFQKSLVVPREIIFIIAEIMEIIAPQQIPKFISLCKSFQRLFKNRVWNLQRLVTLENNTCIPHYEIKYRNIRFETLNLNSLDSKFFEMMRDSETIDFFSCQGIPKNFDYFMNCMKKCETLFLSANEIDGFILERFDELKKIHTLCLEYSDVRISEKSQNSLSKLKTIIFCGLNLRQMNLSAFANCDRVRFLYCVVSESRLSTLINVKHIELIKCQGVTNSFGQDWVSCKVTIENCVPFLQCLNFENLF